MLIECALDHRTLNAFAATVDQAHLAEARLMRRPNVLMHDVDNVTRREGMKVQGVFDRDLVHRST